MLAQASAEYFAAGLRLYGVQRASGVPCSQLAALWSIFDRSGDLTPAVNEGAALAMAAGWELAGTRSVVLCQNSGLGNLINPLTSLLLPYEIPVLAVMTLRGWPEPGRGAEPQHAVMGAKTLPLLELLDIPFTLLDLSEESWRTALADAFKEAAAERARRRPYFLLIVGKALRSPPARRPDSNGPENRLTRSSLVSILAAQLTDQLLVTTTGLLSREVYRQADRPGNFYMQGSMGHAAAIALGCALGQPRRRVVALDGDGAFLMHLGTGVTLAASRAENLVHLVVDNGCYESTGCQSTSSDVIEWSALAQGLGYRNVFVCDREDRLAQDLRTALCAIGPVLCVLKVRPSTEEVHPRVSSSMSLPSLADRFRISARGSV